MPPSSAALKQHGVDSGFIAHLGEDLQDLRPRPIHPICDLSIVYAIEFSTVVLLIYVDTALRYSFSVTRPDSTQKIRYDIHFLAPLRI